jgi:hypothetical protein
MAATAKRLKERFAVYNSDGYWCAINGSDCKAFEGEVCGLQLRWLLVITVHHTAKRTWPEAIVVCL